MSNVRPEVRAGMGLFFMKVGQQPQRQDSLDDQLHDLHRVAARLGMYDAADWLWKHYVTPSSVTTAASTPQDDRAHE